MIRAHRTISVREKPSSRENISALQVPPLQVPLSRKASFAQRAQMWSRENGPEASACSTLPTHSQLLTPCSLARQVRF